MDSTVRRVPRITGSKGLSTKIPLRSLSPRPSPRFWRSVSDKPTFRPLRPRRTGFGSRKAVAFRITADVRRDGGTKLSKPESESIWRAGVHCWRISACGSSSGRLHGPFLSRLTAGAMKVGGCTTLSGITSRERCISGTVMVFADGSRANNVTEARYKHYFIRTGDWTAHNIYVRPTNLAYEMDDKAKTATLWRCSCTWEQAEPPGPDAACISAAHFRLGDNVTQVRSFEVAGASVIWYKKAGGKEDDAAAFAPAFGCDILEERRATYNGIGLPTSRYHFVVRSYLPGAPPQTALAPPAGYSLKEERGWSSSTAGSR